MIGIPTKIFITQEEFAHLQILRSKGRRYTQTLDTHTGETKQAYKLVAADEIKDYIKFLAKKYSLPEGTYGINKYGELIKAESGLIEDKLMEEFNG